MNISARRASFFIVLLLIIATPRILRGQTYGNEWLDTSKLHLKFPVTKEGVYRIGYFTIENYFTQANEFLSLIPMNQYRLFNMGKEVPLYVRDLNGNNRFDPLDYVEFVGHKPDGTLDDELYPNPSYHRHTYESMVSDSNYYFFTYRSTGTSLRYSQYSGTPPASSPRANHRCESVFQQSLVYHNGIPTFLLGTAIYLPEYSQGEGFVGMSMMGTSDSTYFYQIPFNTTGYDSTGGAAWIENGMIGSSISATAPFATNHRVVSHVGPSTSQYRKVGDTSWLAMGRVNQKFNLKPSDFGSVTYLLLNSRTINNLFSNLHHSHAKISFPKKYTMGALSTYSYLEDTASNPINIEWSNYGDGTQTSPVIFDEDNRIRISGNYNSGTGKVSYVLPALAQKGRMMIQDLSEVTEILDADCKAVRMKDFRNLINVQESYLMITSAILYNGPKELVKEYAKFWSTEYAVSVNLIEDLYNSFSYGLPHPLAVRRFCKFLLDKSTTNKPEYLLLIGRGYDMSYYRGSGKNALAPHLWRNHIPAIGTPVSDIMYTSGLDGTVQQPAIATGRIPADVEQDVGNYLVKLQGYKSFYNNYEEWHKNILHLGGGVSPAQIDQIKSRFKILEPYPLRDPFAGRVYSYSKAPNEPVDEDFRSTIVNHFNSGVNLVSFLGHGSPSVTDVDVGNPNDYLNENKYPICYFNGCQIGNPCLPVNLDQIGLSEKMFRADRKGAIAFIGQTTIGELYTVADQMEFFYKSYFDTTQKNTIGKVIKNCLENWQQPVNSLNRLHCQELFLQGDPAIPLYNPTLPDYSIQEKDIFLDPPNTIALQDSFRVGIIITNRGRGVKDSFDVDLNRIYPGGATQRKYKTRWKMNGLQDTVYFVIRSKDKATAGNNIFDVNINLPHNPIEFTYDNNHISKTIYLPANGVNLILPHRFAIVGTDTVELVVQKSDLFKESEDFYIEIDTTPLFNSPVLQSLEKSQQPLTAGVLAKWKVKLPVLNDTTQYFWRARLNVPIDEGGTWNMYSFTYIKNHGEGWMQNLHWQYRNEVSDNIFEDLTFDSGSTKMKFARKSKNIYIDCQCGNTANKGVKETGFGAQDLNYGVCKYGIVCIPWDGRKLIRTPVDTSKLKPDMGYPPLDCYWGSTWHTFGNGGVDYQIYYAFDMGDPAQQDYFVQMVDAMDDSMYLTVFSRLQINAHLWKPSVLAALNKLGCTVFDTAANRRDNAYWIALGRKGWAPGTAQEVLTFCGDPGAKSYISLEGRMVGDAQRGAMWSENIGPTNKFNKYYYNAKILNDKTTEGDTLTLDVYGIKNDGSLNPIYYDVTKTSDVLDQVNTSTYKYLKLKINTLDRINNTTPNLLNWRVVYDSVPEGTLYPEANAGYIFHSDTLYEGDSFYLKLPFKNISKTAFRDNITLTYNLSHKITRQELDAGIRKYPAIKGDSLFYFEYKFPTKGMSGPYGIQISVNPQFEQPEKTLVNNNTLINFYVLRDVINPVLDVTFDGRHILNGDIVSASPVIMISSKDENKFLWQKDTSTFDLFLKRPGSTVFNKIPFGSEAQFFAATGKDNKARIEYRPVDLADGIYTLKVQSRDANQNQAGSLEYNIDFNIIREQTVTHFYPYPNPFTSSMRFVFTLTGTEVPEEMNVKIMTAEGRVVKELKREDLGELRMGNNITDWAWDGTDQYGDKLGNGTYFFKVTVKSGGEEVKLRATKGDSSFKEQVGVIYLMR
ncbi:MAG: hypothetical protein KG003_12305 [Bacteroidetes bacterium]|nr:hypothetical protein [Bacteroidota bacterium]